MFNILNSRLRARLQGHVLNLRKVQANANSHPINMTLSEADRRLLGFWVADCAERVLPLFEAQAPSDPRPREAIAGIRTFARGGKRTTQLRALAWAAYAAAREIDHPIATAAARAAGLAASNDPRVGDEEIRWAIAHAAPAVGKIVRQFPVRVPGRSRLNALLYQLDAGLRR